jgi:protein-tyrosine-phosphatase
MNCVNTWVAVFPSNTTGLECSECGAMEGEPFQSNNFEWFRRFMDRSEQHKTKKMREASVKKRTLVLIMDHGEVSASLMNFAAKYWDPEDMVRGFEMLRHVSEGIAARKAKKKLN